MATAAKWRPRALFLFHFRMVSDRKCGYNSVLSCSKNMKIIKYLPISQQNIDTSENRHRVSWFSVGPSATIIVQAMERRARQAAHSV